VSGVLARCHGVCASLTAAALVLAMLACAGCAVGPRFRPPPAPAVDRYTPAPLPAETSAGSASGDESQRFDAGENLTGEWWQLFRSPELDALVATALKENPDVAAARAALREAQELTAAQRGAFYPQLQAQYAASRQRDATGTLSPTLTSGAPVFNLHTAQVSVTYAFDPFGANLRRLESAQAQEQAQRFELIAAQVTLSTNVVAAAIEEGSLRAQLAATRDIVRSERATLAILRRELELGAIAATDVMAQESLAASTEAQVPGLEKQLAQERDLLAVLAGHFPADEPAAHFELSGLTLPRDLPVSVPSGLVRQRPDVLAAEAQLHAASAQVGVAITDLLPQISLTAGAGGTATQVARLFAAGNTFWSAGASLTQTLFAGGTVWHRKRAADAALDGAGAQYRSVVLSAFQQVADALHALELDATAVTLSAQAEQAAAQSLTAVRHNVENGSASELALLQSEQAYQQALLSLVQARASRYADTVALFGALGGGWWNEPRRYAP